MDARVIWQRLRDWLVRIAGGALFAAVIVDSLAMVGRQIQLPLIGSIEIVEAVVLIAASGALVIATLDSAHARVNLLLVRLPPIWRARFERLHNLAAVLLFAALLAGTCWIAMDLWGAHEQSELLHIPYWPLRGTAALALVALLLLTLRRLITGSRQ